MARNPKRRTIADRLFNRRSDFRNTFAGPAGKRTLATILDSCGVLQDPHVPGDPYATHVNIGRQWVGNQIIQAMNLTDEALYRLAENFKEEEPDHGSEAET